MNHTCLCLPSLSWYSSVTRFCIFISIVGVGSDSIVADILTGATNGQAGAINAGTGYFTTRGATAVRLHLSHSSWNIGAAAQGTSETLRPGSSTQLAGEEGVGRFRSSAELHV